MRRLLAAALLVVIVLGAFSFRTLFVIVDETKQVVITQWGSPVRVITEPGLHLKVPFIQTVTVFERRLQEYDAEPRDVITQDKKTLVIDNYARWRIVDPLLFLQAVKTQNAAHNVLDDIIYSELRVEIGKYDLLEIVSQMREVITENVTRMCNEKAAAYGIEVVDVRIKRADLPKENEAHVFERMRSERQRQARLYRSEGMEEAAKLRAAADKEKEIILAEAYKEAQQIMGQGDALATKIYADAFSQDADFYAFWRSLEAYRKSLEQDVTVVLSPDSDFLKYLQGAGD